MGNECGKKATNEVITRTAAWDAERAELESALANARAGLPDTPTPTETEITGLDPAVLIQRLGTLNEDNRKKMREALFCFQGLVEVGTPSIPNIKKYFESGEKVTLTGGPSNGYRPYGNNAQANNNNNDNNDRRARMREAMSNRMHKPTKCSTRPTMPLPTTKVYKA